MKILIFYPENKLGMSDFSPTDYSTLADRARKELNGKIPNFGNKVWLQGILSEINSSENSFEFGYEDLSSDYINNNFDCVLLPLANCFHKGWIPYLEKRAAIIQNIKIPVYVIACGIQASSYDELDELISSVKEPADKFIRAVYNTGGEFALRGYFTKEFFDRLGYKSAVVTGCPSLFQMGKNLNISNEKVSRDDFKATINGTFKLPIYDKDIKKADYICQDVYGKFLYDPQFITANPFTLKRVLKYIKRGDFDFIRALANNKIKLFGDTQQWMSYFIINNINFSFGSRIHGSIMPILSGVPALCYTKDARTREMVEFFDIPSLMPKENEPKRDLYELYCETDYSAFNKGFAEKYDNFESFLQKCGLVKRINENNSFMSKDVIDINMPEIVNATEIMELRAMMNKNILIINCIDKFYRK